MDFQLIEQLMLDICIRAESTATMPAQAGQQAA
jgi:hypothetical protein